jgi:hypothetical protein
MHPLVDEAMKKAAIVWLTIPGQASRPAGSTAGQPVWCLWIEGALCVVSGPGEQPAPGLADARTALVSVRGDHGGRILTWPASVSRVAPDAPEWAGIAGQLAAKRLNAPGTTDETVARWAADGCVVSRLTPVGDPTEMGATLADSSGAAAPRPTPASRRTANPFRLHRVRRPR